MADLAIANDPHIRPVLVEGNPTLGQITHDVSDIVERKPPVQWYYALALTGGVTLLLFPVIFTGRRVNRWEGVLLIVAYLAYMAFLMRPE